MDGISGRNTTDSLKLFSSSGTHVLAQLATDGAGLTGGQVAVVAVLEVHADLIGGLHLELVHGLTGLGDVDLAGRIIAAHIRSLLFCSEARFRGSILSRCTAVMIGDCRKERKNVEAILQRKKPPKAAFGRF